MAGTESPGRKPSKLPRFVEKSVQEQAEGLSSMLKKMSENNDSPSPKSSQGSINSKIPLFRSNSEKNFSNTYRKKPSSVSLKLDVRSLESLKFNESFKDRTLENFRLMQLVKDIPTVWIGVVIEMCTAYNDIVQFLINNKLDKQPEKLSAATTNIAKEIEAAKSTTATKLTMIAKDSVETEKLLRTIPSQNQKITILTSKLKTKDTIIEELKLKLQQENKKASSMKQALEIRLMEKTEALGKALSDLAAKTTEKPPEIHVSETIETKKEIGKTNSGKQVQLLKSTVKKLETNIEKLSKQNENLRKMLSNEKRRSSENESETKVAPTLKKILNEKHHNLEKLSNVIQMIKEHHNASRDQRTMFDGGVQLLKSQI